MGCRATQHATVPQVQCGDFRRYTVLTACYPKLLFKGAQPLSARTARPAHLSVSSCACLMVCTCCQAAPAAVLGRRPLSCSRDPSPRAASEQAAQKSRFQQALHSHSQLKLTCSYPAGIFEEPSLGLLPPSQVVVMEGDFNKQDIVVQVTKPSTIYRALHNQSPKLRGILSETGAPFHSSKCASARVLVGSISWIPRHKALQ